MGVSFYIYRAPRYTVKSLKKTKTSWFSSNKHVVERMGKRKIQIHQDPSNPISLMPYGSPSIPRKSFFLSPTHTSGASLGVVSQAATALPMNLQAHVMYKKHCRPTIVLIRFYPYHSVTSNFFAKKKHITVIGFQALHLPGSYCQIQCQSENWTWRSSVITVIIFGSFRKL